MTETGQWQLVPQELDDFLAGKGHNALLGLRYHAHTPDWVELAMPWHERLVEDRTTGALASGPIMALMDTAIGVAVYPRRGGYLPQVTLDLRIDHLRPTAPGAALVCRGECYRLNPTVAFVRGVAYEESPDEPACHAAATYMLL